MSRETAPGAARIEDAGDAATAPCFVIGYDGTASARAAVDWAARNLAAEATLLLVYASRPLHAPEPPFASEDRHRAARACFDELLLESGDELLSRPFETAISDLDPASALIEAAAECGARAILVGGERHTRLRSAFGTVASELLRRSPVPVVAVPAD